MEFLVENDRAGARLDLFLAERAGELSRSRIQALVRAGHVTVDGGVARPSQKLQAGEKVRLIEPPPTASETLPEEIPLSILHEDDDLLVIDKPAGMVVHPAAGNTGRTLVNALLHHCGSLSVIGGEERPGIVHRLDKDTSGCIVVARNDTAHRHLSAQFAERTVSKIYLAVVAGRPRQPAGTIDAPIARHPVHRKKMAVRDGGRSARTDYRVLSELPGSSLVECVLHSGRTHQIRVHMKHLGHPLLGDPIYGKSGDAPRLMLHAWRLGFEHPRSGARLAFEAPLPGEFPPVNG